MHAPAKRCLRDCETVAVILDSGLRQGSRIYFGVSVGMLFLFCVKYESFRTTQGKNVPTSTLEAMSLFPPHNHCRLGESAPAVMIFAFCLTALGVKQSSRRPNRT